MQNLLRLYGRANSSSAEAATPTFSLFSISSLGSVACGMSVFRDAGRAFIGRFLNGAPGAGDFIRRAFVGVPGWLPNVATSAAIWATFGPPWRRLVNRVDDFYTEFVDIKVAIKGASDQFVSLGSYVKAFIVFLILAGIYDRCVRDHERWRLQR